MNPRTASATSGACLILGAALLMAWAIAPSMPLLLLGAGCLGCPFFVREGGRDERPSDSYHSAWAREASRGLPGHEHLAGRLESWVTSTGDLQSLPSPWDPSSAEEVETMIEGAAARTRTSGIAATKIDGARIYTGKLDPADFGGPEWQRRRIDQLTQDQILDREAGKRRNALDASGTSYHSRGAYAVDIPARGIPEHVYSRRKALTPAQRRTLAKVRTGRIHR